MSSYAPADGLAAGTKVHGGRTLRPQACTHPAPDGGAAPDIAMLGSGAVSDVMASLVAGVVEPIHQRMLTAMGVNLFDNCDPDTPAACAARHRWIFPVTANPLAVAEGTGSPVKAAAVI